MVEVHRMYTVKENYLAVERSRPGAGSRVTCAALEPGMGAL